MSDDEWRATESLKNDDSIMILPAYKGKVTVVMNKDNYYVKCNALLRDQKLKSDTTNKFKKKFVISLKDLKDRKVINQVLHNYETNNNVDHIPSFSCLPEVHIK